MKKNLYLIKWLDCYGDPSNAWTKIKSIKSPKNMICLSVGWIKKETKDNITIVPHVSGVNFKRSKRYGTGIITIPTIAILERIKL
jgi:hypothetical protein